MSRLIYCAHALIDHTDEPDWVGKLAANPFVLKEGWVCYRPSLGFMENAKVSGMLPFLEAVPKITVEQAAHLRLDGQLFEPLQRVQSRLVVADHGPFLDVAWKRLYALVRADICLVDLNVPDHGCAAQEAMTAYLAGIPVVGVAHRFIVSPTMAEKLEAVVFPRTSDQLVRQVLAFDHKLTAAIRHYRGEQQLRDLSGKMAELQKSDGAEPDGDDESAR